jgi:hypothetical protein
MNRCACWVSGFVLALCQVVPAQVANPPGITTFAVQMGERVTRLSEDLGASAGATIKNEQLVGDTKELALTIDEFREALREKADMIKTRQAFAGVDGAWQNLRAQLTQPGVSSDAVKRDTGRIDELAGQIRLALGANEPPAGFYSANTAPTGLGETQRLAHALVMRADALAGILQSELGDDPVGAPAAQEAVRLHQAADKFYDSLDQGQPLSMAAQAFGQVDVSADRVENFITNNKVSLRVQNAWQAFASVEVLIHQNLGLRSRQPAVLISASPPAADAPSPILALAEQLAIQSNAFVQAFGQTARTVPEEKLLLNTAERLRVAAADFRDDAKKGLSPAQLAFEFRDVDASWQRLARRANRLARTQAGINTGEIAALGAICDQIHRALGMPGYPTVLVAPR